MVIKLRVRSPRYPSFSLTEAETMARRIYNQDGMNAVDRESAVQHLGYSSLNGASATALASLNQYGLTVDAGKGAIRLSNVALDLLEPESEKARADAVRIAAFTPDLFASLREKFPETVPSESNLRAHLVRQQFTSSSLKTVVSAYLETCEYVASVKETERHGHPSTWVSDSSPLQRDEGKMMTNFLQNAASIPPLPPIPPVAPASTGRRMVFDTEEGEVMFTYPDALSDASVDDLEEWFALVVKRLRRATKQ